jgi:hypothetical protein
VLERAPALEAEFAGDGVLRARQPRGAVSAKTCERILVAGPGSAQQLLRALARLLEIDPEIGHDDLPSRPAVRIAGQENVVSRV